MESLGEYIKKNYRDNSKNLEKNFDKYIEYKTPCIDELYSLCGLK